MLKPFIITDDMVEAARFTLSSICGFEITAQTARKSLESAQRVAPAPAPNATVAEWQRLIPDFGWQRISESDLDHYRSKGSSLRSLYEHPALSVSVEGPQDISTAPAMTDVLVWWPIVKLDEDGDPTDEVVGGCWIISEDQGGYWIEPEVMNAIGDHMGDDHTYADKPSHWAPLPTPLFTATASEGSADE